MQKKTIKRNIENKLNEWLSTITNVELRNDIRRTNGVLVSGGSIASMFLGDKINDYDVYIRDINLLKRIAEYYISPFSKDIMILDGRIKSSYVEDENVDNGFKISIANLKENQIKLFVNSGNGGYKCPETEGKYVPVFFSPNAISLSDDLQIVLRFHGNNEEVHKTFDFVHATNYFTFDEGLVTNLKAMESLMTKQLYYQGSQYPVTSIIRMKKFIKRGFNIHAGEILKMIYQCSLLDLSDPVVLEEQLIGVDIAYFDVLIKALKGVDKNKINVNYLATIIDKIFNE